MVWGCKSIVFRCLDGPQMIPRSTTEMQKRKLFEKYLFYCWRYSPYFIFGVFYLARERISKSTQPNPLFRNSFFRGMNRNRSGSIRNITAHLINDKNTSIAETCIVFNGKSAGNNPRWIYWSYEFSFFRPLGLRTWRPAGEDPDVKIWRSKGLTP